MKRHSCNADHLVLGSSNNISNTLRKQIFQAYLSIFLSNAFLSSVFSNFVQALRIGVLLIWNKNG